jgi:very-short-patch-repair endonuclease
VHSPQQEETLVTRTQTRRRLRHDATPAEQCFWEAVRNRRFDGYHFRRQHSLGRFVVDFYCPELHLAIEIDGAIHQYQQPEDAARSEYLQAAGISVVRFTNDEILHHRNVTLERLRAVIATLTPNPSPYTGRGVIDE